jgi:hypothetical protein
MIDMTLERNLRLLNLQVESWKKLHNLMSLALDKAQPLILVEQERQFTEVRSVLLQESEHILGKLNLSDELGRKTTNVLERATSIRGIRELASDERRRFEADWNAVFTRLGVVQGQLKARRKELLSRNVLVESFARIFGRQRARR